MKFENEIRCTNCESEFKFNIREEEFECNPNFSKHIEKFTDWVEYMDNIIRRSNLIRKVGPEIKKFKNMCATGDSIITDRYFKCPICGEEIKMESIEKVTMVIFDGEFFNKYDLSNLEAWEMKEDDPIRDKDMNYEIYYINKQTYKNLERRYIENS